MKRLRYYMKTPSVLPVLTIAVALGLFSLSLLNVAQGSPNPPATRGDISGVKEFISTDTFVVPPGITKLLVELWGAGGGGGGGGNGIGPNAGNGGGGGGGGGYVRSVVAVTPGQALKIIIGDGGDGGPLASDGSDGGDSSIITSTGTVLSFAGGGKGGRAGVSQPPFVCADNPLPAGAGGIGGQGDPAAAIRRAGIDGKPGRQTGAAGCAPCSILTPFAAAGGLSGFAVNGSLAPPGSIGGDGGHGASTSFIGNCTNRPAEMGTAGSPGTKGYILVMW